MSVILPRFVVIKSVVNNKYLKRISKEESSKKGVHDTFLTFLADDISSRYIKFEIETAQKDGQFVHIKCCHNNKYLSIQEYKDPYHGAIKHYYIEATAVEPIEDAADLTTTTMFMPLKAYDGDGVREYFKFLHHATGFYAYHSNEDLGQLNTKDGLMAVSGTAYDSSDRFRVVDWESLVIFPKTPLAFKLPGKDNKYLSVVDSTKVPHYLQFVPDQKIDNKNTMANEISCYEDGCIRIKNKSTGMFWMVDSGKDWVTADYSEDTDVKEYTVFWPIKLSKNTIALRDWKRYSFCQSYSSEDIKECLNSSALTITDKVKLEVVENIISKSIYEIRYHKDEGKLYNLNVVQKGYASADNYEDVEEHNEISLKFSYKKTTSSNFGSTHSLKLGGKATLKVDWIPFIVENGIEFTTDYTYEYQWGETTTSETLIEATYTAKVPKMKRVKVTLVATEGMCEVPFSYTRRDIHYNGDAVVHKLDDGIYKGVSLFNFDFRSEYEDLPPKQNHKIEMVSQHQSTKRSPHPLIDGHESIIQGNL
ncbi:hypothetical protein F8388_016830 [Cannabis sativa]|uniref:Agglutinin domain-containing protein n=1 Tax=Cannabis sativa TaxID=3483 RepID=A0A7J6ERL4_CANSA|nr:hypothetical protein F8388_016830 [Cannabis sativa]